MMDQGLNVTLHSDDPTMIPSTLAGEYLVVAEKFGLSPDQVKKLALASLDATWLDDATKKAWTEEWSAEIDRLIESELP
jgi:adenosine deaminase